MSEFLPTIVEPAIFFLECCRIKFTRKRYPDTTSLKPRGQRQDQIRLIFGEYLCDPVHAKVVVSRHPADDRSEEVCVLKSPKGDATDISGYYPGLSYHYRRIEGNEATLPTTRKARRVPRVAGVALECWRSSCIILGGAPLPTPSHRPRFLLRGDKAETKNCQLACRLGRRAGDTTLLFLRQIVLSDF